MKNEVNDARYSLQFSMKDVEDVQSKLSHMEKQCQELDRRLASQTQSVESLSDKHDYLENMSHRNNIKVIGIPEYTTERGEESEALFKSEVKKVLYMDAELHVERAQRLGSKRLVVTCRDGSKVKAGPRPIVVKMSNWKQQEKMMKKAREIKLANVKFLEDFSKRTLDN